MPPVVLIPLLVILLPGILFVALRSVLVKVRAEGTRRIAERFPGGVQREELAANFFGRTSAGLGQVRGNGALALTADRLWFSRFTPRLDIDLPLDGVVRLDTTRTHLGQVSPKALLRVTVRGEAAGGSHHFPLDMGLR